MLNVRAQLFESMKENLVSYFTREVARVAERPEDSLCMFEYQIPTAVVRHILTSVFTATCALHVSELLLPLYFVSVLFL